MRSIERLEPTASAQHGLLTRRQLLAAGVDRAGLEASVRSGELHRVVRGVYATAAPNWSREQRILAGCLQARTVAAASHLCAASTWSLWTTDAIELSVRYPSRLSVAGGTVHRSRDLERRYVTRVDGVPVTTPARTICDLGLVLPEFQVHRILDHALIAGLVAADELASIRRRIGRSGRNGPPPTFVTGLHTAECVQTRHKRGIPARCLDAPMPRCPGLRQIVGSTGHSAPASYPSESGRSRSPDASVGRRWVLLGGGAVREGRRLQVTVDSGRSRRRVRTIGPAIDRRENRQEQR